MPSKMYVIVCKDLNPGLKTAQACHAIAELVGLAAPREEPGEAYSLFESWMYVDKTIVVLEVGKDELQSLSDKVRKDLEEKVEAFSVWREPDMGNEITAIACLPKDPAYF